MRSGRRAFIFATLLALALVPQLSPAQAIKDSVAVDTKAGYARILFTFQVSAPVNASVADGVLTIKLTRPIDTTIDAFTESLGSYVSGGRRDEDGLTYRFALKIPVALHNSTQVNRTAIDLVPDSFKGVPPNLPPPPPPPIKTDLPDLAKLPVIKLRIGEYANFTRLIFDWPKQVPYAVYPGRGRISIRFETLARPDFSALESRAPAWVRGAGWRLDGVTTIVDFDTDAEAKFHDFRDENKIAIDVIAPKTDASAYAPPDLTGGSSGLNPTPVPPPKAPSSATAAQGQARSAAQSLVASAEATRDGGILHFPAAHGRAVAVFVRGETIWIVLDNHPALDATTLLSPLSTVLVRADTEQVSGATVLRVTFKSPLLATITETEVALNIVLSAGAATPADAIALTRQGAEGQTTLTTPLPGATHAVTIADAQAGDQLVVIPARPGKATLTPKRFVELMALPSAAGLAVIPYADDMVVTVKDEIVTFSRPMGLALSAASGANSAPVVRAQQSKQGPAFIDFAKWGRGPNDNVLASVRALRAAVARLPESESNPARLQLARFLLAHELAPEALGEIRLMQASDPTSENDPSLQAMKGVAQFMMGRYGESRVSLSPSPLSDDPHAALWRAMSEAKLGDFANARHDFLTSQNVMRFYPQSFQTRARLARAETGLAQGDLASASDALDQLPPELTPRESVEAHLMKAQLLAAQGHVNEAVARLRGLEQTDYAPVAAKATYARVEAQLGVKKIKPADAIETLEKLRFRWRGDALELKTLRKLGALYFADSRWHEGLDILRVAALNFPDAELARDAQDDMRRAFNELYLGSKSNVLQPVQALALFYDFIELTPIGRDGDEMIRRLTDRLVTVDLLGPSEQLLDHQVNKRLDGVARAIVATKLAMIYLLDHKPKEALKTINDTRQTRLPDDINLQRRLLEARALAGLKQYDAAVDLIADDDASEAKKLRADIYWESGNWAVAGAKTEDILGQRWNVSGPLSAEERAQIMRAAVAYSLGSDEQALERLRERYASKMNASPDAKAFAVVTEKIDQQGVAFRDLAKSIAAVDTLQAFMADFKKQETASN